VKGATSKNWIYRYCKDGKGALARPRLPQGRVTKGCAPSSRQCASPSQR
jgi:hypothetical protein